MAGMLCNWKGNRRSGIVLAMHYRLQWSNDYKLKAYEREMSI